MKRLKCMIFCLTVAAMLFALFALPLGASTAPLEGVCGADGANLTWVLDAESGALVISGSGEMEDYTLNDYNRSPFYQNRLVKSITVEGGVMSIGAYAFANCGNLTDISIPDSVTKISGDAFYGCDRLTYTVSENCRYLGNSENPHAVLVRVEDRAVSACSISEAARLILNDAFAGCENLTSVTIPNAVRGIGESAFAGCASLERVTFGGGLERIGQQAFFNCEKLSEISIPSSVRSIGMFAFRGCQRLYQDERGVRYVDKWAISCETDLSSVSLRSNTVGIASAAFESCTVLQSIALPKMLRSISDHAFVGCESLKTIKLPAGLVNLENVAFGSEALEKVIFCGTEAQWNAVDRAENWCVGAADYTFSYHETVSYANGREVCAACGAVLKEATVVEKPETSETGESDESSKPSESDSTMHYSYSNVPDASIYTIGSEDSSEGQDAPAWRNFLSGCSATALGGAQFLFLLCGGAAMLTKGKQTEYQKEKEQ